MRRFAVALVASLTLAGCADSSTSTTATKPLCLTNAPGKLCGGDAKSFCQNMKEGQTVDPTSVDATTRRQCAALGVPGLH